MIKRNSSKRYLIVDLSYLLYYKSSSTYNWYTTMFNNLPYTKQNIHKYNFASDDEYINLFDRSMFKSFNDLIKQHKVRWENIILAKDCRRSDIWRRDLFPEYKENRNKTEEEKIGKPQLGSVFTYAYDHFLPLLQEKTNCKLVEHNACEGDDIISSLTRHLKSKPNTEIVICANDSDLSQLITTDNIQIWNMKHERVDQKVIEKYGGKASNIVKVKVLAGDSKDNVDQAFKRCGVKTALKYLNDPELLKLKIKEDPSAIEKMKLNKKLLDLTNLPDYINEYIIESYNSQCTK